MVAGRIQLVNLFARSIMTYRLNQLKHAGRIAAKDAANTDCRCEGRSSMNEEIVFLAILVAAKLPCDKERQTF